MPMLCRRCFCPFSIDFLFIYVKFSVVCLCLLTCFSNKSLLADKQVTKYFVKLKNELSTSNVKCSRDDLCNINDITRNPRFCWNEQKKIILQFVEISTKFMNFAIVLLVLPESYAVAPFVNFQLAHIWSLIISSWIISIPEHQSNRFVKRKLSVASEKKKREKKRHMG